MYLSSATLLTALISAVLGRELSLVRRDGNQVVVKSKGDGNYMWFCMSIDNGVPQFIIKGAQKDEESAAKANVQLRMENIHEVGSTGYSLQGTQQYWSEIGVEEVRSDEKDAKSPKQMILRSRMVHQDQDIAGNYFSFILEATIDENAHEFNIRPMIQNFPYAKTDGKGKLDLTQVFSFSRSAGPKMAMESSSSLSSPFGTLQVNEESAIEDGNPGKINAPQMKRGKQKKGFRAVEEESAKAAEIEFLTTRPKNATFMEVLSFNADSIKLPIANLEKDEVKDKIKGMSTNNSGKEIPLYSGILAAGLFLMLSVLAL